MNRVTYRDCYFAPFATDSCQGRLDRAHFVRQQDIRREWERANPRIPTAWIAATPLTGTDLDALLADPRNWRPGCRWHHSKADGGWLAYEPPASAYEFARDYDLDHYLPIRVQAA